MRQIVNLLKLEIVWESPEYGSTLFQNIIPYDYLIVIHNIGAGHTWQIDNSGLCSRTCICAAVSAVNTSDSILVNQGSLFNLSHCFHKSISLISRSLKLCCDSWIIAKNRRIHLHIHAHYEPPYGSTDPQLMGQRQEITFMYCLNSRNY